MSGGAEFIITGLSIFHIFWGIIFLFMEGATIFVQIFGIWCIIFGSFILFIFYGGNLLEYLGWYIY